MHFVNSGIQGGQEPYTVIGITFEITQNPQLESEIFTQIEFPAQNVGAESDVFELDFTKTFEDLLMEDPFAYVYKGSLTTPGCDEVV